MDTLGSLIPLSVLHSSSLDMALRTSKALNTGLLNITLVTHDLGRALADTSGGVVGLNPVPRLDWLLADEPDLMAMAAERFVRWLYPPGTPSRIPLVAVTGYSCSRHSGHPEWGGSFQHQQCTTRDLCLPCVRNSRGGDRTDQEIVSFEPQSLG